MFLYSNYNMSLWIILNLDLEYGSHNDSRIWEAEEAGKPSFNSFYKKKDCKSKIAAKSEESS